MWPGFTDEVKKGIADAFSKEINAPATLRSRAIPIQRMADGSGASSRGAADEAPEDWQPPESPQFDDYGPCMPPLPDM